MANGMKAVGRICGTVRMAATAAALLLVSACASEPQFKHDAYDDASANTLFAGALNHLSESYIEPVDLRAVSVAGLNGLTAFDPEVKFYAGPGGGFIIHASDETPARFPPPIDRDPNGWAKALAQGLSNARSRSEALQAAEPDDIYTAIMNGITATLDGYSRYEPPKQANESRARREGYGGIGITIRTEEGITEIQDVLPKTPAARAGLLKGDVITHADGLPLADLEREDRAERLRGPIGTPVAVSIQREGAAPFTVNIVRAEIKPVTVFFEDDKDLPRFRITAFSRNTADSLAKAIAKAEKDTGGLDGIVLDLRGNPGGYLTQAIEVADLFLDSGVVISTRGRHPSSTSSYRARAGALASGKPVILLIDSRSASASELLAAALVDAGRAAAIGSVTYGKGSIQNLEPLANGGELIITWSRMHAPSGYLLDGLGVRPTICTANGEAGAALNGGAAVTALRDWRSYRELNDAHAAALRATCPEVDDGGDGDLEVARWLLKNRNAYKASLRPTVPDEKHATSNGRTPHSG